MHTIQDLRVKQSLPLDIKINMTKQRIREWVSEFGIDGVYVSFSGGKDSTVLLHIARQVYPDIKAMFVDTGLEYPEIREFVKTIDNVDIIRPSMNFKKVIEQYGYPIISKDVAQCLYDVDTQSKIKHCDKRHTNLWDRSFNPDSDYAKKYPQYSRARYDFLNDAPFPISHRCCDIMKKKPAKKYEKETGRKPIIATMTCESRLRLQQWLQDGCNAFDVKRPTSKPLSFWTEQDVLSYIKCNNIKISSIYGDIVPDYGNTEEMDGQIDISDLGLIPDNRKYKTTGAKRTGCMFCLFGCTCNNWDNLERMKETHPKQYDYIMRPKEQGGLNFKEVIDWTNEHGNLNIKY